MDFQVLNAVATVFGVSIWAFIIGYGFGLLAARSKRKQWVKTNCCYECLEKLRYEEED